MAALELNDVSKTYRSGDDQIIALDHADLAIDENEILTLIGPSGSGKTTLLSIAGGLLSPSTGRVRIGGDDIGELSNRQLTRFRAERIGFVFQSVNLVPFLTARENLMVVADMSGQNRRVARKRADQLLDELGLGGRLGNLPDQLSGGERQRVAIGRALMNQPELVLFDEPTSALDSSLGEQVMELIHDEVKSRHTAAIVVTHDPRIVGFGDRTQEIIDGQLQPTDAAASALVNSMAGPVGTSGKGV